MGVGNPFREKVLVPVQALLRQGLTPRSLALALAWGAAIGLIPFPAVATLLAVGVAAVLRLNQAAIQVGNYALGFVQLAMFLPYIRMGEWLFNRPPLPLSAEQLRERLQADAMGLVTGMSESVLHALIAWMLTVPVVVSFLFLVLRPVCDRILARLKAEPGGGGAADGG